MEYAQLAPSGIVTNTNSKMSGILKAKDSTNRTFISIKIQVRGICLLTLSR